MRSALPDILPPRLRRGLRKFGADIAMARRKRRLTMAMMAERLCIARSTYVRVERGDPAVSMGTYAMALFCLGFGDLMTDLVDSSRDSHGLLLDNEHVPKRIRLKKMPNTP